MSVVMEITAPHGSCRIEKFPSIESFIYSKVALPVRGRFTEETWEKMRVVDRYDIYFKVKKRILSQHTQGIRAFMRQHRNGRKPS